MMPFITYRTTKVYRRTERSQYTVRSRTLH